VKDFGIRQMEIQILGLPAQCFVGGLCVYMIVKRLLILMGMSFVFKVLVLSKGI